MRSLLVSSRLAKVVFVLLECRTCSPVSLITRQSQLMGCRGSGYDHVVARKREKLHCPIQALHRYGLARRIVALFPLFLGACVSRSEGYKEKEKWDMQEALSHQRTRKGHQTRQ